MSAAVLLTALCGMLASTPWLERGAHGAAQPHRLLVLIAPLSLQDGHADNSLILYDSSIPSFSCSQ